MCFFTSHRRSNLIAFNSIVFKSIRATQNFGKERLFLYRRIKRVLKKSKQILKVEPSTELLLKVRTTSNPLNSATEPDDSTSLVLSFASTNYDSSNISKLHPSRIVKQVDHHEKLSETLFE
ncbi:hypothetical protein ACI3LY_004431 [Candidozyma auris]|uniref:Uncharacterized protein n=1 Tax=Candidozyma auris TaxID=498019 RepID=A0A0L0P698_CANAR|nr:hypothetical protein QG37_01364 [[Candida] auris]